MINMLATRNSFSKGISYSKKYLAFTDTGVNLPSDCECVYTSMVVRKTINANVFLSYYVICPWI